MSQYRRSSLPDGVLVIGIMGLFIPTFIPLLRHTNMAAWADVSAACCALIYVAVRGRSQQWPKIVSVASTLAATATTVALFVCHHRYVPEGIVLGVIAFMGLGLAALVYRREIEDRDARIAELEQPERDRIAKRL